MSCDIAIKYRENNKTKEKIIRVEEELIKNSKENKKLLKKEYTGILEIPKINLKRVFDNRVKIVNNVNDDIILLKPIDIPEDKNSVILFAGHSGNSNVSYFKNLHKLEKNDIVYIYFKNYKYKYLIYKYYIEKKDGDIFIDDNTETSILVLTTCKGPNKQLIYIAHYKGKEAL